MVKMCHRVASARQLLEVVGRPWRPAPGTQQHIPPAGRQVSRNSPAQGCQSDSGSDRGDGPT